MEQIFSTQNSGIDRPPPPQGKYNQTDRNVSSQVRFERNYSNEINIGGRERVSH